MEHSILFPQFTVPRPPYLLISYKFDDLVDDAITYIFSCVFESFGAHQKDLKYLHLCIARLVSKRFGECAMQAARDIARPQPLDWSLVLSGAGQLGSLTFLDIFGWSETERLSTAVCLGTFYHDTAPIKRAVYRASFDLARHGVRWEELKKYFGDYIVGWSGFKYGYALGRFMLGDDPAQCLDLSTILQFESDDTLWPLLYFPGMPTFLSIVSNCTEKRRQRVVAWMEDTSNRQQHSLHLLQVLARAVYPRIDLRQYFSPALFRYLGAPWTHLPVFIFRDKALEEKLVLFGETVRHTSLLYENECLHDWLIWETQYAVDDTFIRTALQTQAAKVLLTEKSVLRDIIRALGKNENISLAGFQDIVSKCEALTLPPVEKPTHVLNPFLNNLWSIERMKWLHETGRLCQYPLPLSIEHRKFMLPPLLNYIHSRNGRVDLNAFAAVWKDGIFDDPCVPDRLLEFTKIAINETTAASSSRPWWSRVPINVADIDALTGPSKLRRGRTFYLSPVVDDDA